jgi:hypothetical protein
MLPTDAAIFSILRNKNQTIFDSLNTLHNLSIWFIDAGLSTTTGPDVCIRWRSSRALPIDRSVSCDAASNAASRRSILLHNNIDRLGAALDAASQLALLSMGRALELRHKVQTSGPVAVLRPASNFQHSSTRHKENIVMPKQGLKPEMDEGDENCTLLGYYAASSGNFLLTFRDNLSVPSSEAKRGPIGCPETSERNYS